MIFAGSRQQSAGGGRTRFAGNLGAVNHEVRSVTAADWSLLRDVSLRALADSPDAFRTTLDEARTFTEDVWRQRAEGSGLVLVALEDGREVAMGAVFTPPDGVVAEVWGMWTAPEARGRGYGGLLLTDLVGWCRVRGLGLRLQATEGNQAARRLYAVHGFRPTGVLEPLREGSELRVEEMQLVE